MKILKTLDSKVPLHISHTIKAALLAAFFFLSACGENQKAFYSISGKTMGTTYNIKYEGKKPSSTKKAIDQKLQEINMSLSTYIDSSIISRVNQDKQVMVDEHFKKVFAVAKDVYKATDGYFEPTIAKLVNAWGFGYEEYDRVDSISVDSLMDFVGFEMVQIENDRVKKELPGIELDFSAIAKGYGVDQIAELLESRGVENYLVEIGGELRTKGKSKKGKLWNLGIYKPEEGSNEVFAVCEMDNESMATSGNYRNFKIVDGKKYVHTIDPKTGYAALHSLLSASVVSKTCVEADAYATAFMAMGKEKTQALSKKSNDFGSYLIYLNEKDQMAVWSSPSLSNKVEIVP